MSRVSRRAQWPTASSSDALRPHQPDRPRPATPGRRAFRVFDSVFVLTRGSVGTETVSILGYHQLLNRLNLGMGSAISVLVFACVLLLALLIIRGSGASLLPEEGGARR